MSTVGASSIVATSFVFSFTASCEMTVSLCSFEFIKSREDAGSLFTYNFS
jgi:hypothetical protein